MDVVCRLLLLNYDDSDLKIGRTKMENKKIIANYNSVIIL